MSSCDKLTTRKVVRFLKGRGGNGQVWWDLGSVVITGVAASRSCNWECYVARQLVIILEPLICERKLTSWDGGRVGP